MAAKLANTLSMPAGEKKTKVKKEKKAEDAPVVNITPKGKKKGKHLVFTAASDLLSDLHQTSLSQWLMVTIQLQLKLPVMTGGKAKTTYLLR